MTPVSIALNRFGYGYRRGEDLPADPRGWLRRQIDEFRAVPAELNGRNLSTEWVIGETVKMYNVHARRREMSRAEVSSDEMQPDGKPASPALERFRSIYVPDVALRGRVAIASDTPFLERLVHFWANHFAVSTSRSPMTALVGHHEFAAIRPNVTGNFRDLLRAAALHPAMLLYLDQVKSFGPSSVRLTRRSARNPKVKLGLNENLGREILELHTLGVGGGYSQADVTELARALTGWVMQGMPRSDGAEPKPNGAAFLEEVHEPGTRTIMDRSYAQTGANQALAILDDLALHPSTARHIATKLARHFAGDEPPTALVRRLERTYLESQGDLPAVYRALIDAPDAWVDEPVKFRQPWEWLIGVGRAAGEWPLRDLWFNALLQALAQPAWGPSSPAGYDDRAASWKASDALFRRVEVTERVAKNIAIEDVRALAQMMFPGSLSPTTEAAIRAAESNEMAFSLLALSPEMLRR